MEEIRAIRAGPEQLSSNMRGGGRIGRGRSPPALGKKIFRRGGDRW